MSRNRALYVDSDGVAMHPGPRGSCAREMPMTSTIERHLARLEHGTSSAAREAAEELVALGQEAVPRLREALRSPSRRVRRRSARILGRLGAREALQDLVDILQGGTVSADGQVVLLDTIADLAGDADWEVLPLAAAATRHKDPFVRRAGARALGAVGGTKATPRLLELVSQDPEPMVMAEAARQVGRRVAEGHGRQIPEGSKLGGPIAAFLSTGRVDTSSDAGWLEAATRGGAGTLVHLLPALLLAGTAGRMGLLAACRAVATAPFSELLLAAASSQRLPEETRVGLVETAAAADHPDPSALIGKLLELKWDSDTFVRAAVWRSIGKHATSLEEAKLVLEGQRDPEPWVREQVIETIVKLAKVFPALVTRSRGSSERTEDKLRRAYERRPSPGWRIGAREERPGSRGEEQQGRDRDGTEEDREPVDHELPVVKMEEIGGVVDVEGREEPEASGGQPASPEPARPAPRIGTFIGRPAVPLAGEEMDWERQEPEEVEGSWLARQGAELDRVLRDYGIKAAPVDPTLADQGPAVVRFKVRLEPGERVSRLESASEDIGRELALLREPLVGNLPGTRFVALDLPRPERMIVPLLPALEELPMPKVGGLPFLLGQAPDGTVETRDLARLPHLLVAGGTGSGKTMFLYSLLLSLLSRLGPGGLSLLLVDPKQTDLVFFEQLPHLLGGEVVLEPQEAIDQLSKLAAEVLPERTTTLRNARCRDVFDYNSLHPEAPIQPIVVVVDEYADLCAVLGRKDRDEFEDRMVRLAQRARNVGIHLVISTQRPSADVVATRLKTNLPARMAFRLPAGHDSRTIIDRPGAQHLLGKGDMLFAGSGGEPVRLQGFYITTEALKRIITRLIARHSTNGPSLPRSSSGGISSIQ